MSHLRNAFRFNGQPQWFDFYNCRVMLPEQGLFFFIMPYVLSGTAAPQDRTGLYVYDGGNGGPTGSSIAHTETIGSRGWTASNTHCEVRWRKPASAECVFSETEIRATGPSSRWDVRVEPYLADLDVPETNVRKFDMVERMILARVPFIHRVPRMKAFATGSIVQDGQRYEFDRGVVYQAKNHGHGFPDEWIWIHANSFQEDEDLAMEIASLKSPAGGAAIARIATPDGVRVLSSWQGDEVWAERDGNRYSISADSHDGFVRIQGEALHGDQVTFSFPAPDGRRFENDESLVGEFSVQINDRQYCSRMAALARAHLCV